MSILGTDINPRFLAKAEAGVYSEWSFRGAPEWFRQRYFAPAEGRKYAIVPAIKSMVQLGYLNLAEDTYPALHNHTNAAPTRWLTTCARPSTASWGSSTTLRSP